MFACQCHRTLQRGAIALALLLLLALPVAGEAPPDRRPLELPDGWERPSATAPAFEPGRLLVLYEPGAPDAARAAALTLPDVAPIEQVAIDLELVQVPVGAELALAAALRAQPGVLAAEPDYAVYALGAPNDSYYSRQWYHSLLDSPAAWDLATGSDALLIAVIDSGADLAHPDLAGRLIAGHDYVGGGQDDDPRDEYGHGTHVAGLIGALSNNNAGIAGATWQADLLIIRVLNATGGGAMSNVVKAIDEAIARGAAVINLSLGSYKGQAILQPAIDRAHAAGIVVVAAMGNDGSDEEPPPMYPAACEHVIAVAATDRGDHWAYYSNYGDHVDLAAPGGEIDIEETNGIYSTMPTYTVTANGTGHNLARNYDYWQGTSMATALVSGLSALLLGADPTLTPDEVEDILAETALDLGPKGWDQDYGWGRIRAARAVGQVAPPLAVRDLTITAVAPAGDGRVTVNLAWTPPLHANTVTIRRSTAPITAANWNSAAVVATGVSAAGATLTANNVPYTGGTLYFALRTDSAYAPGTLWSEVSNNAFWPFACQAMLPLVHLHR